MGAIQRLVNAHFAASSKMHHIREGKHGANSATQAVAIGLSKARQAGFDPGEAPASAKRPKRKATKRKATSRKASPRRSSAATEALKRQRRRAASHLALSRQAHSAARKRTKADRSAAARKGGTHARALARASS